MDLDTPLEKVPKIGPHVLRKLKRLKISTIEDLIYHIPFRYENIGEPKKISGVGLGEYASVTGTILESRNIRTRYGKNLTKATINDGTASIESVWFNQPFLIKTLKSNQKVSLAGKVNVFSGKPTLINPTYEIFSDLKKKAIHTQGIVPVYPETFGLSSKWIRTKIKEILPTVLTKIVDPLPNTSLQRNNLIPLRAAVWQIHSPEGKTEIEKARRRLAFDELLLATLQGLQRRNEWKRKQSGVALETSQEQLLELLSSLPFQLTGAQRKVLKEIINNLGEKKPMNRLLQGDVGSGKTVVAAIIFYLTFLNGYQSAFMAPTEVLAIQHFNTIKTILEPFGMKTAIHTSTRKLKEDKFDIVVGTHALISKGISFKKLALIVIDEQHRFGVTQRAILRSKGATPHVLTMTATPIPRSLALTLYGDLDISVMDEMPPNRKLVKTYLVPPEKRSKAYQFIREQITKGKQAFIIFPLIEPSETLSTVKAATEEYKRLQKDIFPEISLGLLHGRIKSKEKEEILRAFLLNKFSILVSTPVVEVGIDIPQATVMMIEGAERFGLASLHQLRGRVGRSASQSYCLLFTESSSRSVFERLSALEKHHVGLKLAEIDLKMRGPGQIYGTLQSGLPDFKIANLSDLSLLQSAKTEADILFDQINSNALTKLKSEIEKDKFVSPD